MQPTQATESTPGSVIGKTLKAWLKTLSIGFGLLLANSLYLLTVHIAGRLDASAQPGLYQGHFYLSNFLAHLILGLALIPPLLIFLSGHLKRAIKHPNKEAVAIGLILMLATLALTISGLLLTRLPISAQYWPQLQQGGALRNALWWIHSLSFITVIWAFIVHRLASRRVQLKRYLKPLLALITLSLAASAYSLRTESTTPSADWFPSLSQGPRIEASQLMRDQECAQCHPDIAAQHQQSAHRHSSFSNPAYRIAIQHSRQTLSERDGNPKATRHCAGCHDPVLLFSGAFDKTTLAPESPAAQAGITCLSCHAIEALPGRLGNGQYRLNTDTAYPFDQAQTGWAHWLNQLLIRAKPERHRYERLKAFHQQPEFCAACHKVHLPKALNHYRWLRGQNHYDSYRLSGASGHSARAYYYPDKAKDNCNHCHMPAQPSTDPAAKPIDQARQQIHDHRFAAANTALGHWHRWDNDTQQAQQRLLKKATRLDLFALQALSNDPASNDPAKLTPLNGQPIHVKAGHSYRLHVVIRNLATGHALTQGTADSNQIWLAIDIQQHGQTIAASGQLDAQGRVDPKAWFGNALLLDRQGQRIQRRNVEDIASVLYDHQTPAGSAQLIRYRFQAPADGPINISARLRYRKFDRYYSELIEQELGLDHRPLPIIDIASANSAQASDIPAWERWNDLGIAWLNAKRHGALRQAQTAFQQVEALGQADGPLNLARLHIASGELKRAQQALQRAARHPQMNKPWQLAWLNATIDQQQGRSQAAIEQLQAILNTRFPSARQRGFDFSEDDIVRQQLVRSLIDLANTPDQSKGETKALLQQAKQQAQTLLKHDPENLSAHQQLSEIYRSLGQPQQAQSHQQAVQRYQADELAATAATDYRRQHPIADHASNPLAIYPLSPTRPTTHSP